MARCRECSQEFEGNRQPRCPFCGAVRPRPMVRAVARPEPVVQEVVDHSLETRRKRKDRNRADTAPPPRPRLEALAEAVGVVDLEFAFGGPGPDLVLPVTAFDVLPERGPEPDAVAAGAEQNAGIARLNAALGRFRRARR